MADFSNSMSKLIRKIDRRLGTYVLNLPEVFSKEVWAEVIIDETLETFSRFLPHMVLYSIIPNHDIKDGYYIIDPNRLGDFEVIGVKDLSKEHYYKNISAMSTGGHITDLYAEGLAMNAEDIMMHQMNQNIRSVIDMNVFVDFEPPNRLRLTSVNNLDISSHLETITIEMLVKHPSHLMTIPPTMMEYFEKLAIIDIKTFLYAGLKHFDNLETVFGTVDLKIEDWASAADNRDEFVEDIREKYISAANKNQPMMITI